MDMDLADSYDSWAALYDDAIAGQSPDDPRNAPTGDVAFYRELAAAADGPVLEIACGTGRIYLPLRRDGIDVDGIDLSAGMLSTLRERASEEGLNPSVWQADARRFAVDREYDLAIYAFRAFTPSYSYVNEHYGEPEIVEFEHDGEQYRSIQTARLVDEVNHIARNERRIEDASGEPVAEFAFDLALIPPRQFELLFEVVGFADWEVQGGFEGDELTDASQEQVWLVTK